MLTIHPNKENPKDKRTAKTKKAHFSYIFDGCLCIYFKTILCMLWDKTNEYLFGVIENQDSRIGERNTDIEEGK